MIKKKLITKQAINNKKVKLKWECIIMILNNKVGQIFNPVMLINMEFQRVEIQIISTLLKIIMKLETPLY
jgi:hypothetical protein